MITDNTPLDEYRSHPAMRLPMGNSAELLYLTLKKEAQILDLAEASTLIPR